MSEEQLRTWVGELRDRHSMIGMALGVVRPSGLEFFHAHGLANIAAGTPITQDTGFRIASITKTFTTLAVMQLWEQGLLDLDRPVNDYLRSFRLLPHRRDDRPATVHHLLTHTSGIPEMVSKRHMLRYILGESVALGQSVPPLKAYYHGGLRLVTSPGSRFTYTDHNFAVAGQLVEDVTCVPLDIYLREQIFLPLGMTATDLLRTRAVEERLATGYTLGRRGVRPVTDRHWVTDAASSIYSTPRDMARYVAALLGGGANEHGTVLKPETVAMMFAPQYQPDPRVPGMGLAFSRFDLGGHLAVEHEGILPGFNSEIFLAPEQGLAVMAFTNGARGAMFWLPAESSRLLGRLLGAPEDTVRTDLPQHPEVWPQLCGFYPFRGPLTDMRSRAMFGAGIQVLVRARQLVARVLSPFPTAYRGFVLHPDDDRDPYTFRIDMSALGIPTARILFRPGPHTSTSLLCDLYPLTLEKR
jgi:CubicO group peptidase (beta-lactamase class C family)